MLLFRLLLWGGFCCVNCWELFSDFVVCLAVVFFLYMPTLQPVLYHCLLSLPCSDYVYHCVPTWLVETL